MTPTSIVHGHAALAGAIGAGLSPVPGPDMPVLLAVQTNMIRMLADAFEVSMTNAQCTELALTLAAGMAGRTAATTLVRWIPGIGPLVCAGTATVVTEAIGWAAIRWFEGTP